MLSVKNDVFRVQISDCYSMCLRFVCKQSDENHWLGTWMSVFGGFFSVFFSGCDSCILKSTTAWLLKLSVLYIHSFMQVHNTTFQIKTVFNNVLFSTEVHNPLHAHLLAQSHIVCFFLSRPVLTESSVSSSASFKKPIVMAEKTIKPPAIKWQKIK